jgi:hypothetical protein
MYGHLGLPGIWVPTNRTEKRDRLTGDALSKVPALIGFGWAIALTTTALVAGAAVLTAVLTR